MGAFLLGIVFVIAVLVAFIIGIAVGAAIVGGAEDQDGR